MGNETDKNKVRLTQLASAAGCGAKIGSESSGTGSGQTSEIYRSDASGRTGDIRRCSSIQDQ